MIRDKPRRSREGFSVLGILLVGVLICESFGLVYPFTQLFVLMIVLVLVFLLGVGRKRERRA